MNAVRLTMTVTPHLPPATQVDHRHTPAAALRQRLSRASCRRMPDLTGGPNPESEQVPPRQPAIIRIMLADDHAIVRDSLARLLQVQSGLEVVGRAGDGQEAVELALELKPDVIVMDVSMPRLNGMQATRRIKAALPQVHVIGLSMHKEEDMAGSMKAAGASHYLAKTAAPMELVQIIRACCGGPN